MKRKSLVAVIFVLVLCTALVMVLASCNNTDDGGSTDDGDKSSYTQGLEFELDRTGEGYTVKKYKGTANKVVIPSIYNDMPVISIGDYAFYGCSSLTSITMPSSITSIYAGALAGCSSLTSITIPESVTRIDISVFYDCRSMEKIVVDKNNSIYTSRDDDGNECNAIIEKNTGKLVQGFENSIIPNNVTSIGDRAFWGCNILTSIVIPNSVTSIGDRALENCDSLTIYVETTSKPNGWNDDWNAGCPVVWNCNNNEMAEDGSIYVVDNGIRYALKDGAATAVRQPKNISGDIVIPSTITYKSTTYHVKGIGGYAFDNCDSLTSVIIPESVTSIGMAAFQGCDSFTSITIPCSVISIGNSAFDGCSSLTNVIIPEGVTNIGNYAFDGCSSLTSITIPESVTSIGNLAFFRCSSLTSVTIPSGVTSIGINAFSGCNSLTSVTIPSGVTSIENNAFYNCSSLTIYAEVTSKPTGWDSDWNSDNRPVYWYSDTEPTGAPETGTGYWHYDTDGVTPIIWDKKTV